MIKVKGFIKNISTGDWQIDLSGLAKWVVIFLSLCVMAFLLHMFFEGWQIFLYCSDDCLTVYKTENAPLFYWTFVGNIFLVLFVSFALIVMINSVRRMAERYRRGKEVVIEEPVTDWVENVFNILVRR